MTTFSELGLSDSIVSSLTELGFEEPTPIQNEAIPALLTGADVLGRAATGTGKTAAFSLPLLERHVLGQEADAPLVLVLTPTRELCLQVSEAFHNYGRKAGVLVTPIYGGQDYSRQIRALRRGTHVVVATPGRALDHIGRGTLDLTNIKAVVLDEADEMLDLGFADELDAIFDALPGHVQTALFSATLPPKIARIAEARLVDPVRITIAKEKTAEGETPRVPQIAYVVGHNYRTTALGRILDLEAPELAIIFTRTRMEVDDLTESLRARGFSVEALHGGLDQPTRDRVMKRARSGQIDAIVATDVAARGIDLENLTHVINFGIPASYETYVHRIGRTGRAGKQGTAITFVSPSEFRGLNNLMRDIKVEIKRETLPSPQDIVEMKRLKIKEEMQEIVENESYDGYKEFAEELLAEYTPDVALGALLRLAFRSELDQNNYPEIRSFSVDRKGTARLFLAVGKRDGYTARKLVDMLKFKCGLRDKYINDVQISDNFSFVSVPFRDAEEVVRKLNRLNRGRRPMAEIARDGENGAQEAPVRKPRRTKTEDYQAAGQTYAPAPKKPTRNVKPATPVPATPTAYDPAPAHDETVHAEPSHDQTAYDPTSSPRRKLKTKTPPHPDIPDFSKMSNEGFDWSAFMKFDEGTAWGRDENGKGKGKATKSVRKTPKKTVTAAQRVAAKGRKRK